MKDWNIILREDIERTKDLKKEYQKLKKEFKELEKKSYTKEKQEQIVKLLNIIKVKLNKVNQLDDKQNKILKFYNRYHFVKYFT